MIVTANAAVSALIHTYEDIEKVVEYLNNVSKREDRMGLSAELEHAVDVIMRVAAELLPTRLK